MKSYDYLIVGGGMAAAAAVEGIRECDSAGSTGLISAESDAPYNRPPLSKALWKGKPFDSVWRKIGSKDIEMHLGRVVRRIVPDENRVVTDAGDVFNYGKLLLATGGRPRQLPFEDDEIIYFRTLSDYRRLRALADVGDQFAVIGGGFIGSEIGCRLLFEGWPRPRRVVVECVGAGPGRSQSDRQPWPLHLRRSQGPHRIDKSL